MENLLAGLASVIVLGVLAQWLAWRIGLPSILILLITGFIVGPVTGLLNPDALLGELLFPVVSLSVAIILFEGGLSLKFSEVKKVGSVVVKLISIGVLVNWVIGAWAAQYFLGLEFNLSVLLGAILTVSGPTVVIPLLRHVRPHAPIGSILKWEGILVDPVGAVLAVLVFEAIIHEVFDRAISVVLQGVFATALIGGLIGVLGGVALLYILKKNWAPEYLQNPLTVAVLSFVFVLSNHLHVESGLLAVTVMGMVLAASTNPAMHHILEFKENLRVLLISSLFILLAARVDPKMVAHLGTESMLFLGVLIFVARPISVFVSSLRSELTWRDKLFLCFVFPRGIVAAAVASIFALELTASGYPDAERLVAYTFLVIVGSVVFYGLASPIAAHLLQVREQEPQGVLIVGANPLCRAIASRIEEEGFRVLLIDTNWAKIYAANMEGLSTYHGNILAEYVLDELDLSGIGKLFAMTPNDEANSLACLHFANIFGRESVFQMATPRTGKDEDEQEGMPQHLRGSVLFGEKYDYSSLQVMFQGGEIRSTEITEDFNYESFKTLYANECIPLIAIRDKKLRVFTATQEPELPPGTVLISLMTERDTGEA